MVGEFSPRDYQQAAVDATIDGFRRGRRSQLLVAATGLGKTVMMGMIAQRVPYGRVLMISHRLELNQQAIGTFEKMTGKFVDLEQADFKADQMFQKSEIVVASVQTLSSVRKGIPRIQKFNPSEFSLIMIDEAHRSGSSSYRQVWEHFKKNPDCKLLGVTATPDRSDGRPLGDMFEHIVADLSLPFAISNGWLVPPKDMYVPIRGLKWGSVKATRSKADFTKKQLAKIVEDNRTTLQMAHPIYKEHKGLPTIAFCASVAQAHDMAKALNDQHAEATGQYDGRYAMAIDGSLPPSNPVRQQIIQDFKDGKTKVLCNNSVLTEGFDHHLIGCLAICRPTKSRGLYIQMLGRGLRPIAGTVDGLDGSVERMRAIDGSEKPNCLVLDFMMQSGTHQLMHSVDVLAMPDDSEEIKREAIRKMSDEDFNGDIVEALRESRLEEAERLKEYQLRLTIEAEYDMIQRRESGQLIPDTSIERRRCPPEKRHKKPSEKQMNLLKKLGYTQRQAESMRVTEVSANIQAALKNPVTDFAKWMANQKRKGKN